MPRGGVDLYFWSTSFRLDQVDQWQCYLSPLCTFIAGSQLRMRARSQLSQPDGPVLDLFTFDQGALICTNDLVQQGTPLAEAYDSCMGERKQELTLSVY